MTALFDTAATGREARWQDDVVRQMVDAAMLAPSAENTQPWRFCVGDDSLRFGLDARSRLPSDVTGLLAYTSIGAAIENAALAARDQGIEPRFELLTNDATPPAFDAGIRPLANLTPAGVAHQDSLFAAIRTRCTSRRMETRPVEPATLVRIADHLASFSSVQLDWITSPSDMRTIGRLVGLGNRIRFEHREFHREFYDHLRLSHRDVVATRDGLDVETLQIPNSARKALAALRTWPRMRFANLLGFSRTVARQAASEVRSSGAIGIVTISEPSLRGMLDGGRAVERLWLAATREGLGFHPTASLPAFLAYGRHSAVGQLPKRLQRHIMLLPEQFGRVLPGLAARTVQMAFRLGHASPPPVRSLRRDAESMFYS